MKITKILLIGLITLSFIGCSSAQNGEKKNKKDIVENKKAADMPQEKRQKVLIKTTLGDITIELYNETPLHRDNFIKLTNEKFYDDLLFHRIIQNFMIQTGDPDSKNAKPGQMLGNGGPGYTIPAEFNPNIYHKRGAVAAARTADQINPEKRSSGSQFYIVDGQQFTMDQLNSMTTLGGAKLSPAQLKLYSTGRGAPFLDGAYTVFGEVVKGMDVVDKIAAQAKNKNDRPDEDIKIISASVIE